KPNDLVNQRGTTAAGEQYQEQRQKRSRRRSTRRLGENRLAHLSSGPPQKAARIPGTVYQMADENCVRRAAGSHPGLDMAGILQQQSEEIAISQRAGVRRETPPRGGWRWNRVVPVSIDFDHLAGQLDHFSPGRSDHGTERFFRGVLGDEAD